MTEWPRVWLLFTTFKRTELALRSISLIKEHLQYPNLHWHVCDESSGETDDGTGRDHIEVLMTALGGNASYHIMPTPPGEFNLGGNVNQGTRLGLEQGVEQFFITCDDDAPLECWDMRPYVDLLDTHQEVGAVRTVHLSEGTGVLIKDTRSQRLDGQLFMWGRAIREWSLRNPYGQTQSYLNTFDMILYHRRFFDAYGFFPEHEHPGLTETHFCGQYNESPLGEDGPQVWVPLSKGPGSPWYHIGKGQRAHYYLAATPNYRKEEE
jgi:hypothetical protein